MASNTGIQWTDHTFNGWWGCTRVGPGCDHCYAADLDKRTGGDHWGAGVERRLTSDRNWNEPLRWNKIAAERATPFKVFASSMCDVFDNDVPQEWRTRLWALMLATPWLNWQILTKRISNVIKMAPAYWLAGGWPKNVGLMATIVNQEEAYRDIPRLLRLKTMGNIPWVGLSCEPLLGPISLDGLDAVSVAFDRRTNTYPFVDWIIVGGESGPEARPMHPDWARSLRDQCRGYGVPFFFKQWGEHMIVYDRDADDPDWKRCDVIDRATPRGRWLNLAGGHGFHGERVVRAEPVGKKKAGRLLDGVEWNEFPKELT